MRNGVVGDVQIVSRARYSWAWLALGLGIWLSSCAQEPDSAAALGLSADTSPPTLTVVMTPATLEQEGFVFFFLNSTDNVAVARTVITVDGQPFVDDDTQYNSYGQYFDVQDNGNHDILISVMDAAGNKTEVSEQVDVQIKAQVVSSTAELSAEPVTAIQP